MFSAMILKYMHIEDEVLLQETDAAIQKEKDATHFASEFLLEVLRRRAFAKRAYSSLFEFLVKHYHFSEPQAAERSNALQLYKSNPEIEKYFGTGEISLTTASQIQRFVKKVKKVGRVYTQEMKSQLIEECVGKSKREVEKTLFAKASEETKLAMKENVRRVDVDRMELKFSIDDATQKKLEELKNLVGNETLEAIFDRALESLLQAEKKKRGMIGAKSQVGPPFVRKERVVADQNSVTSTLPGMQPLQSDACLKPRTPAQLNSRYIPMDFKRVIYKRSGGQCEEVDKKSGRRCASRFRLQIDHIRPMALGGKTELQNLRHLCPQHNARAAIEAGLDRKN